MNLQFGEDTPHIFLDGPFADARLLSNPLRRIAKSHQHGDLLPALGQPSGDVVIVVTIGGFLGPGEDGLGAQIETDVFADPPCTGNGTMQNAWSSTTMRAKVLGTLAFCNALGWIHSLVAQQVGGCGPGPR